MFTYNKYKKFLSVGVLLVSGIAFSADSPVKWDMKIKATSAGGTDIAFGTYEKTSTFKISYTHFVELSTLNFNTAAVVPLEATMDAQGAVQKLKIETLELSEAQLKQGVIGRADGTDAFVIKLGSQSSTRTTIHLSYLKDYNVVMDNEWALKELVFEKDALGKWQLVMGLQDSRPASSLTLHFAKEGVSDITLEEAPVKVAPKPVEPAKPDLKADSKAPAIQKSASSPPTHRRRGCLDPEEEECPAPNPSAERAQKGS